MPSIFGLTHPKCVSPRLPYGLVSFFDYHNPSVSNIIIKGKYFFLPKAFEILATAAAGILENDPWRELFSGFSLVPLPLSPVRRRWRGFNQAETLVKALSEKLPLPHQNMLIRKKNTRTQKDLNREERKANILGSFALKGGQEVRGKNYIIVDDVVTTGATLVEACKVLKRNGANKVWCLTIARD